MSLRWYCLQIEDKHVDFKLAREVAVVCDLQVLWFDGLCYKNEAHSFILTVDLALSKPQLSRLRFRQVNFVTTECSDSRRIHPNIMVTFNQ